MALKGTKLYSIATMTCPRCQESKLFTTSNPYDFSRIFKMPEHCPTCGQKFEMEPGFYYGAMYVGYGVSVAYLVSVWVALLVIYPSFTTTEYLVGAIGTLLLLTPFFFRLSRVIWINLFVKYDPEAASKGHPDHTKNSSAD